MANELKAVDKCMENQGAPWHDDEEQQLLARFDAGASLAELVTAHQRTPAAICTRLVRCGRLVKMNRAYHPVVQTAFATFDQLKMPKAA